MTARDIKMSRVLLWQHVANVNYSSDKEKELEEEEEEEDESYILYR